MSEGADGDLVEVFAAIASTLFGVASTVALVDAITALAVSSIELCDLAGLMTREQGGVETIAISEPSVRAIEQAEIDSGAGPCIDVLDGGTAIYVPDMTQEDRWPSFIARATALGIRCSYSMHIGNGEQPGALNLYAREPDAFAQADRAQAIIFGTYSNLALVASRRHDTAVDTVDGLRRALDTRGIIGQAQGILIERERLTPKQAFDVLRHASNHLNVKLRDVAQRFVDTGERPDTGPELPQPGPG